MLSFNVPSFKIPWFKFLWSLLNAGSEEGKEAGFLFPTCSFCLSWGLLVLLVLLRRHQEWSGRNSGLRICSNKFPFCPCPAAPSCSLLALFFFSIFFKPSQSFFSLEPEDNLPSGSELSPSHFPRIPGWAIPRVSTPDPKFSSPDLGCLKIGAVQWIPVSEVCSKSQVLKEMKASPCPKVNA